MKKVYTDPTAALAGLLRDDMMVMCGGFGLCGIPDELIEAVRGRAEFKSVPILVLSTEFSDEKKARARSAGATGWITKPFDAQKLEVAIRRVCP